MQKYKLKFDNNMNMIPVGNKNIHFICYWFSSVSTPQISRNQHQ
jgi:hypothetical protein